ncbi:hypothetical protein, partial [Bosea sp. NPDC055594]
MTIGTWEEWEHWRRQMTRDRSMNSFAKVVLLDIADRIENGQDLMSEGYLGASLARSPRTIQRAVKQATSAGWLSRERSGKRVVLPTSILPFKREASLDQKAILTAEDRLHLASTVHDVIAKPAEGKKLECIPKIAISVNGGRIPGQGGGAKVGHWRRGAADMARAPIG